MEYKDVFVFAGLYDGPTTAQADYQELDQLRKAGKIGSFQAAVFEKQPDGKVKVLDTTSTSRGTGAKWGAAIGGILGLVFPPAIIVGAAEGAALGALTGNLSKGWFKGDVKRLADQLEPGQAGIVAVAQATESVDADAVMSRASKTQREHVTGPDAEQVERQLQSGEPVGAGRS